MPTEKGAIIYVAPFVQAFQKELNQISEADRIGIFQALQPWIKEMELLTSRAGTLEDVREVRFASGLKCPRCASPNVKRNGKFKDQKGFVKQRYLCRGCGRAFNDLTGTPLAYTKKLDLWGKMARCMAERKSVRKTAETLKVSVPTAFYWRHKLMRAYRLLDQPVLAGIVEADETYFRYSEKGSRDLNRTSRRRGEPASLRGLSREQVCLVVARDRQTQTIAKISGRGTPKYRLIRAALHGAVGGQAMLCTDGAFPYRRFCGEEGIQHCRVDGKKRLAGSLYHINNVNNWHKRFKDWVKIGLRGVATKYLERYCGWFIIMDQVSGMALVPASKLMLSEACSAFDAPA